MNLDGQPTCSPNPINRSKNICVAAASEDTKKIKSAYRRSSSRCTTDAGIVGAKRLPNQIQFAFNVPGYRQKTVH